MSKPEPWKQEGPIGDGAWSVNVAERGWVDVRAGCEAHPATIPNAKYTQHLRDFARALDRAAAALEAASLEPPERWPPEGWKINNPDWPAGEGPHLVPED